MVSHFEDLRAQHFPLPTLPPGPALQRCRRHRPRPVIGLHEGKYGCVKKKRLVKYHPKKILGTQICNVNTKEQIRTIPQCFRETQIFCINTSQRSPTTQVSAPDLRASSSAVVALAGFAAPAPPLVLTLFASSSSSSSCSRCVSVSDWLICACPSSSSGAVGSVFRPPGPRNPAVQYRRHARPSGTHKNTVQPFKVARGAAPSIPLLTKK